MTAALTVRGLSVAYAGKTVLAGLDLSLRPGDAVGLLGPNGSGKSSALGALVGLVAARAGELTLEGSPCAPGDLRLRQRAGVVLQNPSLDARLTIEENLSLYAELAGLGGAQARARVARALEDTGLAERKGDAVLKLSGGQKRRVDLARALLSEPALLLLDEPSTGLDEHAFRALWDALDAQRRARGLAVLVATHRAEEAERCSELVLLQQGRTVARGTPEELRSRVAGDVLLLEVEPSQRAAVKAALEADSTLRVREASEGLRVECERGHERIPRLVESLPAGALRSLSLRRPTMADVFVSLTGRALTDAEPAPTPTPSPSAR